MSDRMRIGARFPNAGDHHRSHRLADAARLLEQVGYDSLWASDHLGMPEQFRNPYPFSSDGSVPWGRDLAWTEPLTALAIAAGATSRIELGTAVMVVALRHPLIAAKQLAGVAVEAPGRVSLGVGAGWLAEEFDAVGVPFERRGSYLDAWIERVHDALAGIYPSVPKDDPYPNPVELWVRPEVPWSLPILIGGMGPRALRRVSERGDGWLAALAAQQPDLDLLGASVESLHSAAAAAGREPPRIVLQLLGSQGQAAVIAGYLPELVRLGVDDVIVDVNVEEPADLERTLETLAR